MLEFFEREVITSLSHPTHMSEKVNGLYPLHPTLSKEELIAYRREQELSGQFTQQMAALYAGGDESRVLRYKREDVYQGSDGRWFQRYTVWVLAERRVHAQHMTEADHVRAAGRLD